MPSKSLPDGDLSLHEMKTKSPTCPSGGYHMCSRLDRGRDRSERPVTHPVGPNTSRSVLFYVSLCRRTDGRTECIGQPRFVSLALRPDGYKGFENTTERF